MCGALGIFLLDGQGLVASVRVVVLEQGCRPALLRRLDYRKDGEFVGRFDGNPMYG